VSAYGGAVLLDMSAWARVLLDRLGGPELSRFEGAARAGDILTSEPFMLEALYSARGSDDYARLADRLAALPEAPSGPATLRLALDAQAELAHTPGVSHRVKPVDLLVSAIAHDHAVGVLHYDHDYDVIAEHSGLRLRSVWIAGRGTID
jgi:predicted nucleic acid-binding protein